jgi:hypothetical protein
VKFLDLLAWAVLIGVGLLIAAGAYELVRAIFG